MSTEAVFIQVGALAEGFAPHSNTLEQQHGLSGNTLTLRFADGEMLSCHFVDEQTLSWGEYRGIAYRATSIRPGILFIDFLDPTTLARRHWWEMRPAVNAGKASCCRPFCNRPGALIA